MAEDEAVPTFEWDIYLLAGVGSSHTLFSDCLMELERRFKESGKMSRIRELFPYGDRSENLFKQLLMVGRDLYRLSRVLQSSTKAAAEQIRKLSSGRPVLFIGHSGGGIAAYRVAVMLNQDGTIPDWRVVQIGSPRMPIHRDHADRVHHIVATNDQGAPSDFITRIGSWGGFSRGDHGVPYWNRDKYAPKHVVPVEMIGGHQHYFRKSDGYVHPDRGSNLRIVTDLLWDCVSSELGGMAAFT